MKKTSATLSKYMAVAILSLSNFAGAENTKSKSIDMSFSNPVRVTNVSEMTEVQVFHTYIFLKNNFKNHGPVSYEEKLVYNQISDNENKRRGHMAKKCESFLLHPLEPADIAVHYWFDQLDDFKKSESSMQREALRNISSNMLNVVQGADARRTITLTAESVIADRPLEWLTSQQNQCKTLINKEGVI